ncbi:MAG: hypothetical protein IKQ16_02330 [Lentisphaeria bacterium]|nr:hypothetical protein [Lentisphaeria bacterium]
MKRCKILIICGGGIFGCIPARFLSMLPTDRQHLNDVDVLAGCSIGGILAAAYAVGQPFGYVDAVFQRRAPECFVKRLAAKINPLACPTYRTDTLDRVINDMIGGAWMSDVRKTYPGLSLVIPALDVTDDHYIAFENISGAWDRTPLADIAGYTSAAPTYYAGRDMDGHCLVDGGIIEVDPLTTATDTIKEHLRVPYMAMDVLMIGTGRDKDKKPLTPERYNALGYYGMAKDFLVPYATLSNKLATERHARQVGFGWFEYYNPLETDGKLDDVKQIPALIEETDKYREAFLQIWNEWLRR